MSQVLHRDGRHGPYLAPDNLTEDTVKNSATATEGYAQIWTQRSYETFGSSTLTKPVETCAATSAPIMPPQKFVTASKAHDIGKWNEGIADGINPEEIEVEEPFENVPPQERKRRVRLDSDDEDENDEELPPLPAVGRVPRLGSDDEEEADKVLPPTSAVRRVPRVSSDDEEENDGSTAPISTVHRVPRLDSDDEEAVGEAHLPTSGIRRVARMESDDEEENIAGGAQSTVSPALVDTSTPDLSLRGERGPSRIRGLALTSGIEEQKLLSPILSPLPSQAVTQPTWTSNPLSILEEGDDPDIYGSAPIMSPERRPALGNAISPEPMRSPPESSRSSLPIDTQSTTQEPSTLPQDQSESYTFGASPSMQQESLETMSPSPSKFMSQDEFDPEKYGKSHPQNSQRGLSRGSGNQGFPTRGISLALRGIGPPPRGGFRSTSAPLFRGTSNFRFRGSHPDQRPRNLVELSVTTGSTDNILPPPGLDIRGKTALLISPSSSSEVNLLDGPLENIQLPSIKPESASPGHAQEEPKSASTPRSSNTSSGNSRANWVNTYNPPRDITKMEDKRLAELTCLKEQQKEERRLAKEAEAEANKHGLPAHEFLQKPLRNGRERKQKNDEISSRQVHITMEQKAPKPGSKRKPTNKNITEKERKQKIKEVLGEVPVTPTPSKGTPEVNEMSIRKKQALKKNPDRRVAAILVENLLNSRQADKLTESLSPLFDASRAFRGDLKFEIQLGQVLIAISKDLVTDDVQYISKKKWESVFSPSAGSHRPPATSFSNTLTRNGHDVDRLLKIKPLRGSDGHGPAKLFDELKPGPSEIMYEFHCQSKESEEFWIVVDANGKYRVRKNISTIGNVNLHYPAHIWDARAVLHGTADFCEPDEEIAMVVSSFMKTVYVPAQEKLSITYRQPAENEMTVRSVAVKRTSLHGCHMMDCQDMQLQVTEVKTLVHRFHTKDKKLSQSFEKEYQEMFDADRIHYEISFIHTGINESLKQNQKLEIGALTNEVTTGMALLKSRTLQSMLDLVSHVVSKIDWAGVRNNGTLVRLMQEQENLHARVTNTVLPGTKTTPLTGTGLVSTAGGKALRSTVPGVRMNTLAEIGVDEDNKPVFIGYGGAKIPMDPIDEAELTVSASEVVPNDSASNIGATTGMLKAASASAAHARGLSVQRGPGFW